MSSKNNDVMQLEEKVRALEAQVKQLKQKQEESRQLLAAEREKLLLITHQKEFFFTIVQALQLEEDFSKAFNSVLVQIGEYTNVDFIKVWECSQDKLSFEVSYEWYNKGMKPLARSIKSISIDNVSSWLDIFNTEGKICSSDTSTLQPTLANMLIPQGIQSILMFPLLDNKVTVGYISFSFTQKKEWDTNNVEMLKNIVQIISTVKNRHQAYASLLQREKALSKALSENKYQTLKLNLVVKASQMGQWDMPIVKDDPFNPNNEFVFSDKLRDLLEYSEDECPDGFRSYLTAIHPDDRMRVRSAITDHLFDTTGQTPFYEEYRLQKKNGEYGYFLSYGESIRDNAGNAIRTIGAIKDITARKKTEAELVYAKEQAEESDRLKSSFLANMSHEIRTPLNAIMGFSNLLVTKSYPDEKRKILLEGIQHNSNQLLTLISDILDISKIESGQLELSYIWINLNQLMQSVNDTLQLQIKNSNKEINLFCQKPLTDVQARIYVDDVRLKQILINLISNAIKFTNQGFVFFGYTVRADNMLEFFVKDTGVGIAADKQANIFDQFRQEDETISRRFGGSGLGLPISKNLVELMGGRIWFESEKDKGSQFFFEIPYVTQRDDATLDEKLRNANAENIDSIAQLFNGEKILVIDDHEPSYVLVSETLSNYDITVAYECSGRGGIAHVENDPDVALILMDIHMPVLNGVETMKIIKEKYPHIPIVAQTAFALKEDQKKFLTAGFDDYAAKPLKNEDLIRVFKRYFKKMD